MILMVGFIWWINPIHAQRLLGGEKGLQFATNVPFNSTDAMSKNYGFQLAMTVNTASGNYWKFGTAYQRKMLDYKEWQLPYDFYNGQIGYFLQAFSNHRKNILLYAGISGIAGYEVFNSDTSLLQDGATLCNKSGFVYGGVGTLSLESYLSNRWVVFGFSEVNYLPKSELTQWQSQFGIGTRIIVN